MKKKRGPKPQHGEGKPCKRRSLSIPDELWEWAEERALVLGKSASSYIVSVLEKHKRLIAELKRKKGQIK